MTAQVVLFAVLALSLTACMPRAPELPPLALAGVHAALEGWRAAGLPEPDERCDFTGVRLRWAKDAAEFWELCRGVAPKNAACLNWTTSNHFFRPTEFPVIVLRAGFVLETDSEPTIHEISHALYRCAGLPWWDAQNTKHLDPRVWSAAGGETSAQSRARALVRARLEAN